jgi:hypothetical protein
MLEVVDQVAGNRVEILWVVSRGGDDGKPKVREIRRDCPVLLEERVTSLRLRHDAALRIPGCWRQAASK